MRLINDNEIAKLTLSLLLAHNGSGVLLGLLELRARHCVLRLLLESQPCCKWSWRSGVSTNRSSRLFLGLGPIGIALITPSHGVLKRKRKGKGLRAQGGCDRGLKRKKKSAGAGPSSPALNAEKPQSAGESAPPVARNFFQLPCLNLGR